MAARAEDLLPVEYFHLVFTLPAEIARIAYWNKKAVYGLLFKASAQTVSTIAADPKRLGAKVGMTSVLHTWGSALTHHLLPGSGLLANHERGQSVMRLSTSEFIRRFLIHVLPPLGRLLRNRLPGKGWVPSHQALRPLGQFTA
jgi:hypothetical protein